MAPSGFSVSVQRCAAELTGRDVTAWELAERLLSLHPGYGDADVLRSVAEDESRPRRPVDEWLAVVAAVVGDTAIETSDAAVIDTRAALLALAHVEPELGATLDALHVTGRLERPPVVEPEPVAAHTASSPAAAAPSPALPAPADILRRSLREAASRGVVPAVAGAGRPPAYAPAGPAVEAPRTTAGVGWKSFAAAIGAVAVAVAAARWLLGWLAVAPPGPAVAGAEDVEMTVFAPPSAAPGDSVLVQAFVHVPEEADDARAIAAELDVRAVRRAYRTLVTPVPERARLDFELRMPGLEVGEPVASLVWRRRTEAVQFAVDLPPDAAARSVTGTLDVSIDGAPVGHVKFTLAVEPGSARAAAEPQGEQAHEYAYAFVSYSSKDRDAVLARVQMLSAMRIGYFQDVMALEPGDRWEKRLEAGIDRCDLFLLFWSAHAKSSSWVRREVEWALARQRGDELAPPEIRPVILERVEPWADLSHLHFDDRALYFMRPPSSP